MDGVLNRNTHTVHKRHAEGTDIRTECGHTAHVDEDQLQPTSVERATTDAGAEKCGGCFEEGGGY